MDRNMNKKDCEHIGYLLSIHQHKEDFRRDLFLMDPRIEQEYEGFQTVEDRQKSIERYEELMVNEFGEDWMLLKASKEKTKEFWAQAELENRTI